MSDTLRQVEVDGHRIAVLCRTETRDATPLVLLHGVLLSPRIWSHVLPDWLGTRPRYAIGLPAHFPSEVPGDFCERPMPPSLFGEGLARVLAEVSGDRPCDLLGHSVGGYAALAIAAAAPERVRSVCTVSPFVQGDCWTGSIGLLQAIAGLEGLGPPLFALGLGVVRSHPAIARLVALSASARPRTLNAWPPLGPMLEAAVADLKRSDRAALRHFFAQIRGHDIHARIEGIRAPVLVVHGTADPVVPFAHARLIEQRVPHARLESLAGVGHLPFGEAPGQYDAILRRWFARFPRG